MEIIKISAANTSIKIGVLGANGDLGSQLVCYLNLKAVTVVAATRAPRAYESRDAPGAVNRITFPTELSAFESFISAFSGCSAIINCIGLPYRADEDARYRRASFHSNFVLPALVAIAAESARIPTIHMSSGRLDRSAIGERKFPQAGELCGRIKQRRADPREHLASLAQKISNAECANSYDLAKRLQECFMEVNQYSKSVRLSNFFGPGYLAARLIPRLIGNRLRGEAIAIRDETRNYIFADDLNNFLAILSQKFSCVQDELIWGYGARSLKVSEIYRQIELLLPACYGTVDFEKPAAPLITGRQVRTISSYFDGVEEETPFAIALARTVRFWRRLLRHEFGSRSAPVSRARSHAVEMVGGGSIAAKYRVASSGSKILVEKSARHLGFEGAGIPKLRAEAEFYRRLATVPALSNLYVEFVGSEENDAGIVLRLNFFADGWTVADQLAAGRPVPERALRRFITSIFTAGYLSDLRTLPIVDSISALNGYYLDRGIERLQNFLDLVLSSGPTKEGVHVFSRIRTSDFSVINGIRCRNPLHFLISIRKDPESFAPILPRAEGLCSHGDLTVLNILFDAKGRRFRLIDPRGHWGYWDPVYDLSKLMFSLSGFASLIQGRLGFEYKKDEFHIVEKNKGISLHAYQFLRDRWSSWVMKSPALHPLRVHEPFLRHRLLFGEAVHYLADVPYRYAIDRTLQDAGTALLLGTLQLEQAARLLSEN